MLRSFIIKVAPQRARTLHTPAPTPAPPPPVTKIFFLEKSNLCKPIRIYITPCSANASHALVPFSMAFLTTCSFLALARASVITSFSTSFGITQTPSKSPKIISEEHTSELQSRGHLVCRLLLDKNNPSHRRIARSQPADNWT